MTDPQTGGVATGFAESLTAQYDAFRATTPNPDRALVRVALRNGEEFILTGLWVAGADRPGYVIMRDAQGSGTEQLRAFLVREADVVSTTFLVEMEPDEADEPGPFGFAAIVARPRQN